MIFNTREWDIIIRACSHCEIFSDCDCSSSYGNKWVVQDSMVVFTLCDCDNNTNSYLAHYKQKQIAVTIRKKRTVWMIPYYSDSNIIWFLINCSRVKIKEIFTEWHWFHYSRVMDLVSVGTSLLQSLLFATIYLLRSGSFWDSLLAGRWSYSGVPTYDCQIPTSQKKCMKLKKFLENFCEGVRTSPPPPFPVKIVIGTP